MGAKLKTIEEALYETGQVPIESNNTKQTDHIFYIVIYCTTEIQLYIFKAFL